VQTLHVQTRLVNVVVNAVDAQGTPVGGLGQDDFEVLEDGKPQKVSYFEKDSSTPLSIVLSIDASESVLGNERLEKEAAKKFVRTLLREQDELDLMDFSDTVREIVSFTNQEKRIEYGLERLERGDATALYDAVYLGSERLASTKASDGRRRVLVLITDGDDTVKGSRYGQAGAGAAGRCDGFFDHYCADLGGCWTQYGRRACADPDGRGYGRSVLLRLRQVGPGSGVCEAVGRSADPVCAGLLCADGQRRHTVSDYLGAPEGRGVAREVQAALSERLLRELAVIGFWLRPSLRR
jgi:hypothetical protein